MARNRSQREVRVPRDLRPGARGRPPKIFILDAHDGDYDDAQRRKRNHVVLFLIEASSALSPPACRHVRWLKARSKRRDTTEYEGWATRARADSQPFVQHWTQRLSARLSSA